MSKKLVFGLLGLLLLVAISSSLFRQKKVFETNSFIFEENLSPEILKAKEIAIDQAISEQISQSKISYVSNRKKTYL